MAITKREVKKLFSISLIFLGIGMVIFPVQNFLERVFPFIPTFVQGIIILIIGAALLDIK